MDIFSPKKRSRVMANIRGKNNLTTELLLVASLRAARVGGWRRHLKLPGTPDFTFPSIKLCVFVHGCFWHGCPSCAKTSATRPQFWAEKVLSNQARDRRVTRRLREKGFAVHTIWECALKPRRRAATIARLARALERRRNSLRPGPKP